MALLASFWVLLGALLASLRVILVALGISWGSLGFLFDGLEALLATD